jgi:hypothetical protein
MTRRHAALLAYEELLRGEHLSSTQEILAESTEKYGATWKGRPMCTSLRPYLIEERTYREAARVQALLVRGLRAAVERLLHDDALRRRIGLPEYLEPLLELDRDRGQLPIIARFDGYLTERGLVCFEANTMPGTMVSTHEVNEAFARMPIARAFAKRFPFRTHSLYDLAFDATTLDHRSRGGEGPPTLATIRLSPETCPRSHFMRWLAYLQARGCTVLSATEEELRLEGGRLYAEDFPIDIFVFRAWEELHELLETAPVLFEAIRAGAVRTFDGIARGLLWNYKATFEALSDPELAGTSDPEVLAALAAHVPWTRMLADHTTKRGGVAVDLLPHVEANREGLVIKPCGASSGAGLVLGWCVDDDAWRRAISEGVARHHVVQERVPATRESFPLVTPEGVRSASLMIDFDLHVWNAETVEAATVRANEGESTNIGSGGVTLPVWVLEDE